MYDLVIVGGGVAGLTASIYAASRDMKVTVIDPEFDGGVIGKVSWITHFPGVSINETGKEFFERLYSQAKSYNIEFIKDSVISFNLANDTKYIITENSVYESKSVIFANGTSPNKLNLNNEDEYINKYIHYSTTDINKCKDKEVFVVGGSDGALKEAIYISNFASKVHIVHFEDSFTGVPEFRNKILSNPKFIIHLHSRITDLKFNNGRLNAVILTDEKSKENKELSFNETLVYIFIGSHPNTDFLSDALTLNNGFIVTDDNMETNVKGVYAAGDIRSKEVRQVATAANDGVIAAINSFKYLKA